MVHNTPVLPFSVAFLLVDGFSNMVLAHAMEPVRAAAAFGETREFLWRTYSPDGEAVTSSSGLRLDVDGPLSGVPEETDLLVVVVGYGFDGPGGADLSRQLRQVNARVGRILGCDMGGWSLAAAGLLDGRRATVHWHELDHFAEVFTQIDVQRRDFVVDGDYVTAGSAEAVLSIMLEIIAARTDAHVQREIERLFGPLRTEETSGGGLLSGRLRTVLRHIDVRIEDRLTVGDIARESGFSRRALERMFDAQLGASPASYIRYQRLLRADRLVRDSHLSVQEIAVRCGFSSASVMVRAYRRKFGVSIRQRRKSTPQKG